MKELWKSLGEAFFALFFSVIVAGILDAAILFGDSSSMLVLAVIVLLGLVLCMFVFDMLAALARIVTIFINQTWRSRWR